MQEDIENVDSHRLTQSEYFDFTSCNQHDMPSVEEELEEALGFMMFLQKLTL